MKANAVRKLDEKACGAAPIDMKEGCLETPSILEEITIEELAVDGICGIY